MKFYKENEVNPFASCLPLVAQIPVFIGLFYMLRTTLRPDICPGVQAAYRNFLVSQHHLTVAAAHGQTTFCTNPQFADIYHAGPQGAGFLFIPDLTNKASGRGAGHAAHPLRRHTAGIESDDGHADDGQEPAADHAAAAAVLRRDRDQLPGRTARLLDHDQPLDDEPAVRDQTQARPRNAAGLAGCGERRTTSGHGYERGRIGLGLRHCQRRYSWAARAAAPSRRGQGGRQGEGAGLGSKPRRDAPPPPPPRKKKKRSGRRR